MAALVKASQKHEIHSHLLLSLIIQWITSRNTNSDGGIQDAKSRLIEVFTKPTNQKPELNPHTLSLHGPINYIHTSMADVDE